MGAARKMRRKKAKDHSYKEYVKLKITEGRSRRAMLIQQAMHKDFKTAMENCLPMWQRVVSLFIPPAWYLRSMTWLVMHLPTVGWMDKVRKMKSNQFIKFLLVTPIRLIAFLVSLIMVHPLLMIRRFVYTFGTYTQRKMLDEKTVRLRIWYWFQLEFDKTYDLDLDM